MRENRQREGGLNRNSEKKRKERSNLAGRGRSCKGRCTVYLLTRVLVGRVVVKIGKKDGKGGICRSLSREYSGGPFIIKEIKRTEAGPEQVRQKGRISPAFQG